MAKKMNVWADLTASDLRSSYEVALLTRASIVTCMQMKTRGEGVEFWIGGPGEEVHGAATGMALDRALKEATGSNQGLALFGHYRSDTLAHMQTVLRGREDFVHNYFRQALSRVTDPHSGGRQMVMHLCQPELGIYPVQSPVGMQLSKAAGYARGLQIKKQQGLAVAVVGDGTTGESDMHEACIAAGLWNLPLLILVTDNEVAITVRPEDGRGIRDFGKYAEAFGLDYFECDGRDFRSTFEVTRQAAQSVMRNSRAAILKADIPRLMGHSSSSGGQFDFNVPDPLLTFGSWLSEEGILPASAIFRRTELDKRKSYFDQHALGTLMGEKLAFVREAVEEVRNEPTPSPESGDIWRFSHPPFPKSAEPTPDSNSKTRVQYNEALNLAFDRILAKGNAAVWGQDVGHRGGIFQVTAGLREKYPELVRDAPINEPMILGTALGAALHPELSLLPEIQFGDYTLNTLHWLVYAGNLYWTSNGQVAANLTLRTPVDPVQGGAVYHSMSVDGFYGNIPGLVITIPSTSYDAYGLLRTAADYTGPVLQMEPKRIYRMKLGPALPGEPDDAKAIQQLRRDGAPLPIADYRIPFGKAARRRNGSHVTIVTWGWPTWQSVAAAERVARAHGIETEVLDLRTIKPYDRDAVFASAQRTGRVLVVQADRTYAGYGRQIQGDLVEHLPGVSVRVVGQLNTPAVGQSRVLEDAITLQESDIEEAIVSIASASPGAWLENDLHWLNHAPSRTLV